MSLGHQFGHLLTKMENYSVKWADFLDLGFLGADNLMVMGDGNFIIYELLDMI